MKLLNTGDCFMIQSLKISLSEKIILRRIKMKLSKLEEIIGKLALKNYDIYNITLKEALEVEGWE